MQVMIEVTNPLAREQTMTIWSAATCGLDWLLVY